MQIVLDQVLGAKAPPLNRIRVTYDEGGERVRLLVAVQRRGRGRRDHVGACRQAGAAAVHALGRARLGQLRPGAARRHPWRQSTRAATWSRSSSPGSGCRTSTRTASAQQVTGECTTPTAGPLDTTISGAQYTIPNRKVIGKSLPLDDNYLKTRPLRAPNAPAGRLRRRAARSTSSRTRRRWTRSRSGSRTSPPPRARRRIRRSGGRTRSTGVAADLELAAKGCRVEPLERRTSSPVAESRSGTTRTRGSRGVVDIEVNKTTGKIVVKHVYAREDIGLHRVSGWHAQQRGGRDHPGRQPRAVRAGRVRPKQVTSLDWVTYPILRFKDAPKITLVSHSRTDVPMTDTTTVAAAGSRSTGSGEPGTRADPGGDRKRVLRRDGCSYP